MRGDERSDDDLLAIARVRPDVLGVTYERHASAVYRYLVRRAGVHVADDLCRSLVVRHARSRRGRDDEKSTPTQLSTTGKERSP